MSETNELTQLLEEVKALRSEVQQLKQERSITVPASVEKATQSPTSRRKMLKAGILAAGLAVTSVAASAGPLSALADDGHTPPVTPPVAGPPTSGNRGISPTTTNQTITVGNAFAPTNASDPPTQLYTPSSTELSPVLFRLDNYTNTSLSLPVSTRVGLASTVSGIDNGSFQRIGVYGATDTNVTTGYGVYGVGNTGVYGMGSNGVYGNSIVDGGNGIYATASALNGWGIDAYSSLSYAGVFASGATANLYLTGNGVSPLARSDTHSAGEMLVDSTNTAWVCVAGGTPGTWRQIAGTTSAGSYHALSASSRVIDTRPGQTSLAPTIASNKGGTPSTTFVAGESRTYSLAFANSVVPAGATAFSAVVTSTNIGIGSGQSGFFQFWTGALSPVPNGSLVTYNVPGVANAGSFTAPLSATRQFNIYTLKSTDVIIDIVGYYL